MMGENQGQVVGTKSIIKIDGPSVSVGVKDMYVNLVFADDADDFHASCELSPDDAIALAETIIFIAKKLKANMETI